MTPPDASFRRRVVAELLDTLPVDDPAAIRSRADLRRVNMWMNQPALMARLLQSYGAAPPASILELGCGDGTFMLRVARRLAPAWPGLHLRLVDRLPLVTGSTVAAFAALGWHAVPETADAFDALAGAPADIVAANLFLHHFDPPALARLLAAIARTTRFIAACEPRRSRRALLGARLLILIGCNEVTRHDAITSVRGGFSATEISELWPLTPAWTLSERPAGLFTPQFPRDPRRVTHDAIVLGAGPAGSVAALMLARAGWSVAIVEKSVFPRRKVCGEFLSRHQRAALRRAGPRQRHRRPRRPADTPGGPVRPRCRARRAHAALRPGLGPGARPRGAGQPVARTGPPPPGPSSISPVLCAPRRARAGCIAARSPAAAAPRRSPPPS